MLAVRLAAGGLTAFFFSFYEGWLVGWRLASWSVVLFAFLRRPSQQERKFQKERTEQDRKEIERKEKNANQQIAQRGGAVYCHYVARCP